MISYGMAKARAIAGRDDWNAREAIRSATILWYDTEDDLDAEDFRAWVEENADSLAQEDAAANGTTFEGIEEIEYETEWIDDDALFDADYEAACESEWEVRYDVYISFWQGDNYRIMTEAELKG